MPVSNVTLSSFKSVTMINIYNKRCTHETWETGGKTPQDLGIGTIVSLEFKQLVILDLDRKIEANQVMSQPYYSSIPGDRNHVF